MFQPSFSVPHTKTRFVPSVATVASSARLSAANALAGACPTGPTDGEAETGSAPIATRTTTASTATTTRARVCMREAPLEDGGRSTRTGLYGWLGIIRRTRAQAPSLRCRSVDGPTTRVALPDGRTLA